MAQSRGTFARTPAEREELYRLRYQICRERGWLQAEYCPSGLERDGHDEDALHLVGRIGLIVTLLAPARRYYGEWRYPAIFHQLTSTDQFLRRFGRPADDA